MPDDTSMNMPDDTSVSGAAPMASTTEIEKLSKRVTSLSDAVVNALSALTSQKTEHGALKEQVNNQEKIISSLMMGYSEVVVIVEVLMVKLTAKYSEDEKKELIKELSTIRAEMQKVIQGAIHTDDDGSSGLAAAFERLGATTSKESGDTKGE